MSFKAVNITLQKSISPVDANASFDQKMILH